MEITQAQADGVCAVIKRQGSDRLLVITPPTPLTPWVGLTFEHIYIGVEPDGHAHS